MSATHQQLPEGRYGRVSPDSSARRLRVVGAVLGAVLLAVLTWFGWSYIARQDVTGQLLGYEVVSDETVRVRLEVRKDEGSVGVCTLRALGANRDEVGLRDVRITDPAGQVDTVAEVRTKTRAVSAELLGCQAAG